MSALLFPVSLCDNHPAYLALWGPGTWCVTSLSVSSSYQRGYGSGRFPVAHRRVLSIWPPMYTLKFWCKHIYMSPNPSFVFQIHMMELAKRPVLYASKHVGSGVRQQWSPAPKLPSCVALGKLLLWVLVSTSVKTKDMRPVLRGYCKNAMNSMR